MHAPGTLLLPDGDEKRRDEPVLLEDVREHVLDRIPLHHLPDLRFELLLTHILRGETAEFGRDRRIDGRGDRLRPEDAPGRRRTLDHHHVRLTRMRPAPE